MSSDDRPDDDFWRAPSNEPGPEQPPGDDLDDGPTWDDDVQPAWHEDVPPVAEDEPAPAASTNDAEPPVVAAPPRGPSRLQRLSGTVAVAGVLVVGLAWFLGQGAGGPAAPKPTPTPTPTITPVTIPDEARQKIWTTDTPATNVFRTAAVNLDPKLTAKNTNTYAVRVETSTNVDADQAARFIQGVLDDPRSWAGYGNNNFRLTADPEAAKLTITIASPTTTDALCGTPEKSKRLVSCRVKNAIVINSDRWHYMVPAWNNVEEYRAYVVNHYTGEFLGQRIAFCGKKGEPAPAMAQQDTNLGGCLPNAWPKLS